MRGTDRTTLPGTTLALSRLGIGGGSLANARGEDVVRAVADTAWDAGLRHFDTAAFYAAGESERRLGAALAERPRDEFVLSTKVGRFIRPDGREGFDYTASATEAAIGTALERLRMTRLDIVFVHDVIPALHGDDYEPRFAEAMEGALPTLLRLKRQGVVGAIGTALRDPAVHLRFATAAPCDVFMLAGSYTLLDQDGLEAFLPHCARSGQRVLLASPFETGLLATGPHANARFRHKPATPELLARTAAIQAICARHGVPLAAAALQFPLHHPAIASVVVGHQAPEEVRHNLALLAHPISPALWAELRAEALIRPDAPVPDR